jgi:hypothetical protein
LDCDGCGRNDRHLERRAAPVAQNATRPNSDPQFIASSQGLVAERRRDHPVRCRHSANRPKDIDESRNETRIGDPG